MQRQPVVVVGGSLAGMAAAARLAKAGHPVRLLERSDRLGGRWGVEDALPGVLTFPAPWRDLFRKSGRTLDAELARAGLEMVPGPPALHRFTDGRELALPAQRAGQESAITAAFGRTAAHRWRDLLDGLVDVWQVLRPLGMEQELIGPRRLDPRARERLDPRTTVADLAERVAEPHLAEVIRSVAWRAGSTPERTPGWCAALLAAERSFGRWQLVDAAGRTVPTSRLLELLAERLRLRRVQVDLGHEVARLELERDRHGRRVTGLRVHRPDAGTERIQVAAVISTLDPWQHLALHRHGLRAGARLRLAAATPARAPLISHRRLAEDEAGAADRTGSSELVEHGPTGPVVRYRRRLGPAAGDGVLESVHDHPRGRPDPSFGLAWHGARSWWSRPPVSTGVEGLWTAGPHSRGGNHPSQVLLSGALSSYACYDRWGQVE